MARVVLQVRGPVETHGEYLCYADGYTRLKTTEFADYALSFGSKSAARRFASVRDLSGIYAVPVEVSP